jgi:hypothetical protein
MGSRCSVDDRLRVNVRTEGRLSPPAPRSSSLRRARGDENRAELHRVRSRNYIIQRMWVSVCGAILRVFRRTPNAAGLLSPGGVRVSTLPSYESANIPDTLFSRQPGLPACHSGLLSCFPGS